MEAMEAMKKRMTKEHEQMILSAMSNHDVKLKQVMESLVAENVDLSSPDQSGLTPMERIYGMHKGVDWHNLVDTYLMIDVLMRYGADPNVNTYKAGHGLPDEDVLNVQSSLLHRIVNDYENLKWDEASDVDFADFEEEKRGRLDMINMLLRAGARVWKPNYNPWERCVEKGFVLLIWPAQDEDRLFGDNMDNTFSSADHIDIIDADGNSSRVDIPKVEGLKEWHDEYRRHCHNLDYDWKSWNERGLALAKTLAAALPPTITLFYPHFSEEVVEEGPAFITSIKRKGDRIGMRMRNTTYLSTSGNPIRISQ